MVLSVTDEDLGVDTPSFGGMKKRAHTRRYGCGSKGKRRESRKFEGALPDNQRWIVGFEQMYAVSSGGRIFSYKSGKARELKITIHRDHPHVRIFYEDDVVCEFRLT